jgi:hypothetical protein
MRVEEAIFCGKMKVPLLTIHRQVGKRVKVMIAVSLLSYLFFLTCCSQLV